MITYDVRAVGNWFLDRADENGELLTAMKLQKLAYVAHGWHLGLYSQPLTHDPVEAWKWGPVFRSLYREFREYGSLPIEIRATAFDGWALEERVINVKDAGSSQEVESFLENVFDLYDKFTAGELSDITHRAGTPWYQMFERMGHTIKPFTVIPNEMIEEHYKKLLDERSQPAGHSTS